jgi:hypothetical protein
VASTGCDQGETHDQPRGSGAGPYLQIVGANAAVDRPLPADGRIQIAFDRFLHPATVVRQSFQLRNAFGEIAASPVVTYDPVARVVTLSSPRVTPGAWLLPHQPYRVFMPVPESDDDTSGPRAADRATLAPGEVHSVDFMTTDAAGAPAVERRIDYCNDVSPVFRRHCSASSCHGAPRPVLASARFPDGMSRPAAGLVLETSIGVANTALGRVAQGSNTGARAGSGRAPGFLFGVDMPIVDADPSLARGNAANSWLMYKVLLAARRPEDVGRVDAAPTCSGSAPAPLVDATFPFAQPVSTDERARLGDLILGREMPYPSSVPDGVPTGNPPLTDEELERVRAWITQGAPVPDCAACTLEP